MTEWKKGDFAMVEIARTDSHDPWMPLAIKVNDGHIFWIPHSKISALRPLPPALSAEDAAVLRAADAQERRGDEWRYSEIGDAEELRIAYMRATDATNCATRARRRSTPPAAVARDSAWVPKVGDRVRTKWVRYANGELVRGTVTGIGASGDVLYKIDNGGGVGSAIPHWLEPDPEPATPRDTTALRDAVVEAAKKQLVAFKEALREDDMDTYDQATTETEDAVRALLAAEAPADPVAELREAAAGVDAVIDGLLTEAAADTASMPYDRLHTATCAADRLRAALSALGDRGRG